MPLEGMLAGAKTVQSLPPAPSPELQARTAPTANKAVEQPLPETQHRAEEANDGLLINGSQSNATTSKFSLDPAFGNRRAGSKALYTGGLAIHEENAVLDARPYSLTGLETPKNEYTGSLPLRRLAAH